MSDKERKKANEKIERLLKEAENAINEACRLARDHKLTFSWDGPSYGMGGYFDGQAAVTKKGEYGETYDEDFDGWNASSQSC
jgi:inosine/xanthosine triphosphate pyrophosphatase family protein